MGPVVSSMGSPPPPPALRTTIWGHFHFHTGTVAATMSLTRGGGVPSCPHRDSLGSSRGGGMRPDRTVVRRHAVRIPNPLSADTETLQRSFTLDVSPDQHQLPTIKEAEYTAPNCFVHFFIALPASSERRLHAPSGALSFGSRFLRPVVLDSRPLVQPMRCLFFFLRLR